MLGDTGANVLGAVLGPRGRARRRPGPAQLRADRPDPADDRGRDGVVQRGDRPCADPAPLRRHRPVRDVARASSAERRAPSRGAAPVGSAERRSGAARARGRCRSGTTRRNPSRSSAPGRPGRSRPKRADHTTTAHTCGSDAAVRDRRGREEMLVDAFHRRVVHQPRCAQARAIDEARIVADHLGVWGSAVQRTHQCRAGAAYIPSGTRSSWRLCADHGTSTISTTTNTLVERARIAARIESGGTIAARWLR